MAKGRMVADEEIQGRFPFLRMIVGDHKLPNGAGWEVLFEHQPDIIHAILADVVKHSNAQPGKVGQRPTPREETVPDIIHLVRMEQNNDPLEIELPRIMKVRGLSERKLQERLSISRRTLQRLIEGDYDPPLSVLEELSDALSVSPSHWVEYRAKIVLAAVVTVFLQQPSKLNHLFGQVVMNTQPDYAVTMSSVGEAVHRIHRIADEVGLNVSVEPKTESKKRR